MSRRDTPIKLGHWPRVLIAFLSIVAFSITIPPLGFLGFLDGVGILGNPNQFFESVQSYQGAITGGLILLFAVFSLVVVTAKDRVLFSIGVLVLVFFVITSLGGCAMMLSGLKNIGG